MNHPTVLYFVTPHGFGHAARSAAVIESLGRRDPEIEIEIVTTVPGWFFGQSLSKPCRVRPVVTDVGLIQIDPMREDLPATVTALRRFWAGLERQANGLIQSYSAMPPRLVVSDISPLGLEVGRQLAVPSILVENFPWDWIYDAYLEEEPGLEPFSERYRERAASADARIQCEPACRVVPGSRTVPTVSRSPKMSRDEARRALGLAADDRRPIVLLTMGGLGWGRQVPAAVDGCIIVSLGGADELSSNGDVIRLPDRSPVYPPDLIQMADAVIGKLGYSTVAECHRAGSRLGFICRPGFPESPILERFVRRQVPSLEITAEALAGDRWPATVDRLLALPPGAPKRENGADGVADLLLELLE